MAYKIVYKKSIARDLKPLPKAEVTKILNRIERDLVRTPEANPLLKGKFAGLRKYRIGDYRVIYALVSDEVLVLRIGHRQHVYKQEIQ